MARRRLLKCSGKLYTESRRPSKRCAIVAIVCTVYAYRACVNHAGVQLLGLWKIINELWQAYQLANGIVKSIFYDFTEATSVYFFIFRVKKDRKRERSCITSSLKYLKISLRARGYLNEVCFSSVHANPPPRPHFLFISLFPRARTPLESLNESVIRVNAVSSA